MDSFRIMGGVPLFGHVQASGAKNAALPILAATLLADGPVTLSGIPRLTDVTTLARLLRELGAQVERRDGGTVHVAVGDPRPIRARRRLVHRMRASFCVLGPLLARRGRAVVPLPGGCRIGPRPVDLHLRGLAALGAELRIERNAVIARARRLVGAKIDLSGPRGPTVTGTANVMTAAVLAHGTTTITGAAREPEIVDLGSFLNALGARVRGLGTSTIEIEGVEQLGGGSYTIMPDRIEAGTLLIAAALTGGAITVDGIDASHLKAVLVALEAAGADLCVRAELPSGGNIALSRQRALRPIDITARPYPGIPTDLQAQFMALATVARGRSRIADTVFPERYGHIADLRRLGARIERREGGALVSGGSRLRGTSVTACDLRASAALVIAGLAAAGETLVQRVHHLDRGYERLDLKLAQLGAQIERVASKKLADREAFSTLVAC